MANELCFMKIEGIDGECNVKDHKNEIEVLSFSHSCGIAIDPNDVTKVMGRRNHSEATVTKVADKATPNLYKALVEGKMINKIEVKWLRHKAEGEGTEHYLTHTFEKCRITNVTDSGGADGTVGETLTFAFGQITWKHEVEGQEFADKLREY